MNQPISGKNEKVRPWFWQPQGYVLLILALLSASCTALTLRTARPAQPTPVPVARISPLCSAPMLLAPPAVADSAWPNSTGSATEGSTNPLETLLNVETAGRLQLGWQQSLSIPGPVLLLNGVVLANTGTGPSTTEALEVSSGQRLGGGPGPALAATLFSSPEAKGRACLIYFAIQKTPGVPPQLLAVNPLERRVVYRRSLGLAHEERIDIEDVIISSASNSGDSTSLAAFPATPALSVDESVLSSSSTLYINELVNGSPRTLLIRPSDGRIFGTFEQTRFVGTALNVFYLLDQRGVLLARQAETGEFLWYRSATAGFSYQHILAEPGHVYAQEQSNSGHPGVLLAMSDLDGKALWVRVPPDGLTSNLSPPALVKDLARTRGSSSPYSPDRHLGDEIVDRSSLLLPDQDQDPTQGVLESAGEGLLYLRSPHRIFAVEGATGRVLWTTPAGLYQHPSLVNGVLYVPVFADTPGANRSRIDLFNARMGFLLGSLPISPAAGAVSALAVASGTLCISIQPAANTGYPAILSLYRPNLLNTPAPTVLITPNDSSTPRKPHLSNTAVVATPTSPVATLLSTPLPSPPASPEEQPVSPLPRQLQ